MTAVVLPLAIARLRRFWLGFQALVGENDALILTHPWIEVAMDVDKARPSNQRMLWRSRNADHRPKLLGAIKAERLEVANPVAFENLFPEAVVKDALDGQACCLVDFRSRDGEVLKSAPLKSLFWDRTPNWHGVSLYQFHGVWFMATYAGANREVPLGTAKLTLRVQGMLNGEETDQVVATIPVVRDMRNGSFAPSR